jgi:maleate cis-trans isomerase
MKIFLEGNGFKVINIIGLGLSETKKIFPISDSEIITIGVQEPYISYKLIKKMSRDDVDGFLIACTNFRAIEIIELLEEELSKPVITSNQASLAIALRRLGIGSRIRGYGGLFNRLSQSGPN